MSNAEKRRQLNVNYIDFACFFENMSFL